MSIVECRVEIVLAVIVMRFFLCCWSRSFSGKLASVEWCVTKKQCVPYNIWVVSDFFAVNVWRIASFAHCWYLHSTECLRFDFFINGSDTYELIGYFSNESMKVFPDLKKYVFLQRWFSTPSATRCYKSSSIINWKWKLKQCVILATHFPYHFSVQFLCLDN